MVSSLQTVRWLAWALVIFAIASAVLTVLFVFGLPPLPPPPPELDEMIQRLEAFRAGDREIFPFVVISSVAGVGVFLVGALLGTALRWWAPRSFGRDAMTLLFVVGGAFGIAGNLLNIAVAQAATFGYCDCGYKAEELIAHDYALGTGWAVVTWLQIGAVALVGVGAAVAGRIIEVSAGWRTLSYLIAIVILFAVALRVIAAFVFIQAFDPFQVSDLIVAVAAGILVPIWAILLARGAERQGLVVEPAAA